MPEVATPEARVDKVRESQIQQLEGRIRAAINHLDVKGKEHFDFARAERILQDAQENPKHAIDTHGLELVQILDGSYRKSVAALSTRVSGVNSYSNDIAHWETQKAI
ncbi:hypothetical protein EXS65_01400 [Candidatus Peribacteria bacterium]|nr:hypothetical protein [Candidatus Peribacteria bacterium]